MGFFIDSMEKLTLKVEGRKFMLPYDEHFGNLVKVNESLNLGAAEHYKRSGLKYVDVPEIVGITGACENVDTLFKIQNRLVLPLFMTQTGQLALEQSLQSFPGVYTVIHSGRDEEGEDERHLRQFRLTEEEFDSTMAGMTRKNYNEDRMYEVLLIHIQKAIQSMIRKVLEDNEKILKTVYRRDTTRLNEATRKNFLRITYEEAVRTLNKNGYPDVKFGDDLRADHEAKILSLLNKSARRDKTELPVFIMKYPKEIKFFNMKAYTKDPRVVLSADLIFPYAGEGTGSAVREHDFEKLNERLITSTMYKLHVERGGKYEDFKWYLDIIKEKRTNPHAGYGIGNERVLQYLFGESDIRNVSTFSLLSKQSGEWDTAKYGQAAIISPPKKHILLTIGKLENKKFLLPYIKKLAKSKNGGFVLYATKNTHAFLKKNGVRTSLVYKISEVENSPNISDLLRRKVFDLIVNIPTREKVKETNEFTDGKLIRKGAVELGISLVTHPEVAAMVITNLAS